MGGRVYGEQRVTEPSPGAELELRRERPGQAQGSGTERCFLGLQHRVLQRAPEKQIQGGHLVYHPSWGPLREWKEALSTISQDKKV